MILGIRTKGVTPSKLPKKKRQRPLSTQAIFANGELQGAKIGIVRQMVRLAQRACEVYAEVPAGDLPEWQWILRTHFRVTETEGAILLSIAESIKTLRGAKYNFDVDTLALSLGTLSLQGLDDALNAWVKGTE